MPSVATALGISAVGAVRAEGDLDIRGTLGVDKSAPVGFSDIRWSFGLHGDASEEQLATLLRLTERYCVVTHLGGRRPSAPPALEPRVGRAVEDSSFALTWLHPLKGRSSHQSGAVHSKAEREFGNP